MQLRVLFAIVNIGIFIVLFALEFAIPAYANLIFYVLLAWFVASFLLLRAPFMNRRVGGPATPSATAAPSAPLPSQGRPAPTGVDAADIGFCPHCGTVVAPGTLFCPACGRTTRIG